MFDMLRELVDSRTHEIVEQTQHAPNHHIRLLLSQVEVGCRPELILILIIIIIIINNIIIIILLLLLLL